MFVNLLELLQFVYLIKYSFIKMLTACGGRRRRGAARCQLCCAHGSRVPRLSVCLSDAPHARSHPALAPISLGRVGCFALCRKQGTDKGAWEQLGGQQLGGCWQRRGLSGPPLASAPLPGQRRVKPTPRSPGPGCVCLDFALEFEIHSYKETFIFLPFNDQTSGVEAQGSGVSISRAVFFLL